MEQCQLCLNRVAKLENSHFLSKGIYKRLRDDQEKNPNPYQITPKGAIQTSKQMTARLLCRACEQRFCKFGEAWVLRHCLQKTAASRWHLSYLQDRLMYRHLITQRSFITHLPYRK